MNDHSCHPNCLNHRENAIYSNPQHVGNSHRKPVFNQHIETKKRKLASSNLPLSNYEFTSGHA